MSSARPYSLAFVASNGPYPNPMNRRVSRYHCYEESVTNAVRNFHRFPACDDGSNKGAVRLECKKVRLSYAIKDCRDIVNPVLDISCPPNCPREKIQQCWCRFLSTMKCQIFCLVLPDEVIHFSSHVPVLSPCRAIVPQDNECKSAIGLFVARLNRATLITPIPHSPFDRGRSASTTALGSNRHRACRTLAAHLPQFPVLWLLRRLPSAHADGGVMQASEKPAHSQK